MEKEIVKTIVDIQNQNRKAILGGFVDNIEKAHVKAHTKKTKSGKMVQVKEHEDKRKGKEDKASNPKKMIKKVFSLLGGKAGVNSAEGIHIYERGNKGKNQLDKAIEKMKAEGWKKTQVKGDSDATGENVNNDLVWLSPDKNFVAKEHRHYGSGGSDSNRYGLNVVPITDFSKQALKDFIEEKRNKA